MEAGLDKSKCEYKIESLLSVQQVIIGKEIQTALHQRDKEIELCFKEKFQDPTKKKQLEDPKREKLIESSEEKEQIEARERKERIEFSGTEETIEYSAREEQSKDPLFARKESEEILQNQDIAQAVGEKELEATERKDHGLPAGIRVTSPNGTRFARYNISGKMGLGNNISASLLLLCGSMNAFLE